MADPSTAEFRSRLNLSQRTGSGVTRRGFLALASGAAVTPARIAVPVHRIVDERAKLPADQVRRFWSGIWAEAARNFASGGIDLQVTDGPGEIRTSAADRPIFVGLQRGAINLVLTSHLPLYWDNSRALAGMTTIHEGYHVSVIAQRYAHGNQVAFLSTNTCVHEILHALLQDVFLARPKWYQTGEREFRVDWYATRLWLFHDGAGIRASAQQYLKRLR